MVPIGQDPHEYTPTPLDVVRAADADLLFWNGLNMELGDGWFENLLAVAGKSLDDRTVVALADGIEPLYLAERRMEMNAHAPLGQIQRFDAIGQDRKSTRLNSSHVKPSYA